MTLRGRATVVVIAALAASVAVNIFAASFILGGWYSASPRIEALAPLLPYPESIRTAAREALRSNRRELAPALARLRRARVAMFDAARARDLDPGAVERAMAEMRAATTELQSLAQGALLQALKAAGPDERAAIRAPGVFSLPVRE